MSDVNERTPGAGVVGVGIPSKRIKNAYRWYKASGGERSLKQWLKRSQLPKEMITQWLKNKG